MLCSALFFKLLLQKIRKKTFSRPNFKLFPVRIFSFLIVFTTNLRSSFVFFFIMEQLPILVLHNILDHCDLLSMINLKATCKTFNSIVLKRFEIVNDLDITLSHLKTPGKYSLSVKFLKWFKSQSQNSISFSVHENKKIMSNIKEAADSMRKLFPNVQKLTIDFNLNYQHLFPRDIFIRTIRLPKLLEIFWNSISQCEGSRWYFSLLNSFVFLWNFIFSYLKNCFIQFLTTLFPNTEVPIQKDLN